MKIMKLYLAYKSLKNGFFFGSILIIQPNNSVRNMYIKRTGKYFNLESKYLPYLKIEITKVAK